MCGAHAAVRHLIGGILESDQHVTVVVETPQNLSAEAQKHVEALRRFDAPSTYPQHDEFWRKIKSGQ